MPRVLSANVWATVVAPSGEFLGLYSTLLELFTVVAGAGSVTEITGFDDSQAALNYPTPALIGASSASRFNIIGTIDEAEFYTSIDSGVTWSNVLTATDMQVNSSWGRICRDYTDPQLVWVALNPTFTSANEDTVFAAAGPAIDTYLDAAECATRTDNNLNAMPVNAYCSTNGGASWTGTLMDYLCQLSPTQMLGYTYLGHPVFAELPDGDPDWANPCGWMPPAYDGVARMDNHDILGYHICVGTYIDADHSYFYPPTLVQGALVTPMHDGNGAYYVGTSTYSDDHFHWQDPDGVIHSFPMASPYNRSELTDASGAIDYLGTNYIWRVEKDGTHSRGSFAAWTYTVSKIGQNWQRIESICMAACDPNDTDAVYVLGDRDTFGCYTWGVGFSALSVPYNTSTQTPHDMIFTPDGTLLMCVLTDASGAVTIYRSTNGGASWSNASAGTSDASPWNVYMKFAVAAGGRIALTPLNNKIAFSDDDGASWQLTDTYGLGNVTDFTGI